MSDTTVLRARLALSRERVRLALRAQQPVASEALSMVSTAARAAVAPYAQRHPLVLVAAAAALGGLFAWSRPWRWLLSPALVAALAPRLLVKGLVQVAPPTWSALLAELLRDPGKAR